MKLVHPDWEMQISWNETEVPVVVIENENCLFRTVDELHRQINTGDGAFVLTDKDKQRDLQKKAELILSPWNMDFAQRKIITKLLTVAHDEAVNEINYAVTQEITATILNYVDQISCRMPVDVLYDFNFDITELFKIVHLRVNTEDMNLPEKMLQYMKTWVLLFGESCFIFNCFRNFMDKTALSLFYQNALAEKFSFVMFESACEDRTKEEKLYIIDRDLCQIY